MGVDVYLLKGHESKHSSFIRMAKKIERENSSMEGLTGALEMFINLQGDTEFLMQFSTTYMQWLCWIVTASGGDPGRIGFVVAEPNTRFVPLIPHGHPWRSTDDPRDDGILLSTAECRILLDDVTWFIEEKMRDIEHCDSLKAKTRQFHEALERVVVEGEKMLIG